MKQKRAVKIGAKLEKLLSEYELAANDRDVAWREYKDAADMLDKVALKIARACGPRNGRRKSKAGKVAKS